MSASRHGDILGRAMGMLVFLLGVGLLLFVFREAYSLFHATPASALGLKITGDPKSDPSATAIGSQFGWMLFRIVILFLMSVSGSLIAQKGVNLYFSAAHGSHLLPTTAHREPSAAPTA